MSHQHRFKTPNRSYNEVNSDYSSFIEANYAKTAIADSDTLKDFLKEKKRAHKLEKENYQLKQKIISNQKQYEDEKEKIIVKHSELMEISTKYEFFVKQIQLILGIKNDSDEIILNEIQNLVNNYEEQAQIIEAQNGTKEELEFLQKMVNIKEKRVDELENTISETTSLYQTMEKEIDRKANDVLELQNDLNESRQEIESLNSIIIQYMAASGVFDSPQASIQAVQNLKKRVAILEKEIQQSSVELKLKQAEERQKTELLQVKKEIEEHGQEIQKSLTSLKNTVVENHPDDSQTKELCKKLTRTNKLLTARIKQLENEKKHKWEYDDDLSLSTSSSDSQNKKRRSEKVLDPSTSPDSPESVEFSVWVAKAHEVLSLERQIHQIETKNVAVSQECQFMAHQCYVRNSFPNAKPRESTAAQGTIF